MRKPATKIKPSHKGRANRLALIHRPPNGILLAEIVDSLNDAIIGTTLDGIITSWNAAAEKMYGYPAAEVLGRSISILAPPDRIEEIPRLLAKLRSGGSIRRFETVRVRRDGARVDGSLSVSPIQDSDGKIVGVSAIARDITESKRVFEALRESELKLRGIFENSQDGISLVDEQGNVIEWNKGMEAISGLKSADVTGRPLWEVQFELTAVERRVPAVHAKIKALVQSILSTGQVPDLSRTADQIIQRRDGSCRIVQSFVFPIKTDKGFRIGGITRDVTERRRAEEEIRQRASHQAALNAVIAAATEASTDLNVLMETALDVTLKGFGLEMGAIWLKGVSESDKSAVLQGVTTETVLALSQSAELATANIAQPFVVRDWSAVANRFSPVVRAYGIHASIIVPLLAGGQRIGGLGIVSPQPREWLEEEVALVEAIGRQLGMTVERVRLFEETRARAGQLELLYDAGLALNQTLDLPVLMESLLHMMNKIVRADQTDFFRFDPESQTLVLELVAGYSEDIDLTGLRSMKFAMGDERGLVGRVAADRAPLSLPDVRGDPRWIPVDPFTRSALWVPVEQQGKLRGVFTVMSRRANAFTPSDQRLVMLLANQLAVALENARLFDETRRRLAEFEAINRISIALRVAQTLDQMLPILVTEMASILNAAAVTIWLLDPATNELTQVAEHVLSALEFSSQSNKGIAGHVFTTGQLYLSHEFKSDPLTEDSKRDQVPAGLGGVCAPIRASDRIIGVFFVAIPAPRQLNQNEIDLLTTVAEIAGSAIHRTRLYEETEQHLRHLDALHQIDKTITSSLDIRLTLNVILSQVASQQQADAAEILLFHPATQTFEYGVGSGFQTTWFRSARTNSAGTHAVRVVREKQPLFLFKNIYADCSPAFCEFLQSEGFVSYYGIPLIAKGKVNGVLELFHRHLLLTTPAWRTFVESIAEQAAIAVDNADLFIGLQRSNAELTMAYDTALTGWSRALDLRDRETEGHTERVTEMTLRLARVMGISDAEMVHIRRGALLHDIGKMAIPDNILFKPGPLTDEEWNTMRKHPTYAHELLSPIVYLHPALDIPYCHHEKWDGTGYPRGLEGEQIPLVARIFAVVDVWDALRSDRPYRPAWSEDKVREHIQSQAGTHFDPHIVKAFIEMVEQAQNPNERQRPEPLIAKR